MLTKGQKDIIPPDVMTTGEAADFITHCLRLGPVKEWQIRRLFLDGDLPEPPRIGTFRIVAGSGIPTLIEALRRHGWLTPKEKRRPKTRKEPTERQTKKSIKAALRNELVAKIVVPDTADAKKLAVAILQLKAIGLRNSEIASHIGRGVTCQQVTYATGMQPPRRRKHALSGGQSGEKRIDMN